MKNNRSLIRNPNRGKFRDEVEKINLGQRVKELRTSGAWSLDELSKRSGISRAAISKIERNQMSPTFDSMKKLSFGLAIDINMLFTAAGENTMGRRSYNLKNSGKAIDTPNYRVEALATDLSQKKMQPFFTTVNAYSLDEFSDWDYHHSEDFMYVLSGKIVFYTDQYEPLVLGVGDSVYYDGALGHACINKNKKPAELLWVSAS